MNSLTENIRAALRQPCTSDLLNHYSISSQPADLNTITGAARLLGVTREHLSRVRHGHRHSRSLNHRYAQLTGQPLRKAA